MRKGPKDGPWNIYKGNLDMLLGLFTHNRSKMSTLLCPNLSDLFN